MAAVLQPSSGLVSPAEAAYSDTFQASTMEDIKVTPSSNFLTQQMVGILKATGYDNSAINTLVSRADLNTIEATNIPVEDFFGDRDSIALYLSANLLNTESLRQQNIYLNSNEPILLLGYSTDLDFSVQQIRSLKENVLIVLRDRGIKPVRVYVRETEANNTGLSFSLLNVVNSDIGVNMVSLLDAAFYGGGWKEHLVAKEAYNGYDLLWIDEAWKTVKGEANVETEAPAVEEDPLIDVAHPKEEHVEGVHEVETHPVQSEPVRSTHYKSADEVPEDSTDDDEVEPVQHPALKELMEREAQKAAVQHPTWSRDHDTEAYLDIIKTHSQGEGEVESLSVISRQNEEEKEDFEVVDKPSV